MNIHIRLFAVAKDLAGRDTIALELPQGSTIGYLRARLAAEVPSLAALLPQVLFSIGSEYATDDSLVSADSEVACIPPVSGG